MCGSCINDCAAEARELVGRRVSVPEVMQDIERDVIFFDESGGGVTFSGGEPLAQRSFLAELLKACQQRFGKTLPIRQWIADGKRLEDYPGVRQ